MEKTLVVELIEARSLSPCDLNGWSDPFAKIYIDSKKIGKSSTIKRTLNPQWKERFTKTYETNYSELLKVEVYDNDAIGKDNLGYASVELVLFQNGKWTDQWYRLKNLKTDEKVRGYVRLRIQFVDDIENAFKPEDHDLLPEQEDEENRKRERDDAIKRRQILISKHHQLEGRKSENEKKWKKDQRRIHKDMKYAKEHKGEKRPEEEEKNEEAKPIPAFELKTEMSSKESSEQSDQSSVKEEADVAKEKNESDNSHDTSV